MNIQSSWEVAYHEMKAERDGLLEALRRLVDGWQEGCHCGYFEEAVSEGNPEGWAVCEFCHAEEILKEYKEFYGSH